MTDNNKKRALGRGLSALLESETATANTAAGSPALPSAGGISLIDIDFIEANPFQPRSRFEALPLQELTDSIRQHGLIQPITVRRLSKDR